MPDYWATSSIIQRDTGTDFVACPVKYYRLGDNTWIYVENDGSAKIGITDLFLKTIQTIKK